MPRILSATLKENANVPAAAPGPHPRKSPEAIRARAYEIYLNRGAQPGKDLEDWVQAERELNAPPMVQLSATRR